MDDQPRPMMNTPIETGITAGEDFEKDKLGRLDRLRAEMNITQTALPEEEWERLEKFKQESFAHFEQLTGLTFDRDTGKCTTEGTVRMEGELRGRWAQMCTRLREERDPQKAEQLMKKAGVLLRGAIEKPTDRTDS
jgi:hypothetical protein